MFHDTTAQPPSRMLLRNDDWQRMDSCIFLFYFLILGIRWSLLLYCVNVRRVFGSCCASSRKVANCGFGLLGAGFALPMGSFSLGPFVLCDKGERESLRRAARKVAGAVTVAVAVAVARRRMWNPVQGARRAHAPLMQALRVLCACTPHRASEASSCSWHDA